MVLGAAATGYAAVSHARISAQSAEKVAKAAQPGTTIHKELKHIHGDWVYIFSIRSDDRKVHQVRVDGKTGKLLSQDESKFEGWGIAQG